MATAILYIRVSTDEQAIKGYSQRYQKEHLEKYCTCHDIDILDVIFEDHSAKNFDRPSWKMMMIQIRKEKSYRPDFLFFTKWDRFGRNAGDAYYVLSQLKALGVEPQAVDQKLDLSIPENKIILGVYLAASEAENDRRSLNIKEGMHKAKQEGKWIAHVPLGYTYILTSSGKRQISPREPEATFIKKAFYQASLGTYTIQYIYERTLASGLVCSNSHFWRILKNPVYCGKVIVPAYENEKEYWAKGLHEPLIDEILFLKVQEVLNNKKKRPGLKHNEDEHMLLRGFLYCPRCNRRLTGSASKGNTAYYYYYHCKSKCGFRIRCDKLNDYFIKRLDEFALDSNYCSLYKEILKYTRSELFSEQLITRKTLSKDIDRLIERIIKAKSLLLHNELEHEDYLAIKKDCEHRIHLIGDELQKSSGLEQKQSTAINKSITELEHFGQTFKQMTISNKKLLLNILLIRKAVFETESDFNRIINAGARHLFHLINQNEKITASVNPNRVNYQPEKENILTQIITVELKRGVAINKEIAREIEHFLAEFSLIRLNS